jgi:trans-2,3-dihydro-3-hydroxyanthranilate isomerase
MRLKFWISDRQTNRWGAVMLWDTAADLTGPMPPNRATELIGYPPSFRMMSDVEAIVEGLHSGPLSDRGLAFETTRESS